RHRRWTTLCTQPRLCDWSSLPRPPFVWHDRSLLHYGLKCRASWWRMSTTVLLVVCLGLDLHSRRGRDVSQVGCDITTRLIVMPSNSSPKATATPSSRKPSVNLCPRTSSPAASTSLRIVPPAPSSTSAQFYSAFVGASTASWRSPPPRAGPHPRVRGSPSPHGSCAAEFLLIPVRHLMACGQANSLPHSGMRTRRRPFAPVCSAYLSFRVLRALFVYARSLPSSPSPGCVMEVALLVREWEQQRNTFTPRTQLRPLPPSLPRLPHLRIPWRSGETEMGTQMEMEWARVDRDGVQVRVCMYPSLTLRLSLRLGTLSFCPPTFAFALALALVPTFAHTLAPPLLLVLVMPASAWREMKKRGCPCEQLLCLTVVLIILLLRSRRSMHMRYAEDVKIETGTRVGACVRLCVPLSRSSSYPSGVFVRIRPALPSFSYADTDAARSAGLGILLAVDAHSHVDDGADEELVWVHCGCAYILPAPSLAPPLFSLANFLFSFSLNSVGSLCSARFDVRHVCPPPSSSPIHTCTVIALNEISTSS
ncbi:hypothetical protein B0H13DRAFT_2444817, partial [Mycena leptocephala]